MEMCALMGERSVETSVVGEVGRVGLDAPCGERIVPTAVLREMYLGRRRKDDWPGMMRRPVCKKLLVINDRIHAKSAAYCIFPRGYTRYKMNQSTRTYSSDKMLTYPRYDSEPPPRFGGPTSGRLRLASHFRTSSR